MQTLTQFSAGDKIAVRSTDHRNGFVRHDGTFMRYGRDGRTIVYDWCGLAAEYPLDRVAVTARSTSFRFH